MIHQTRPWLVPFSLILMSVPCGAEITGGTQAFLDQNPGLVALEQGDAVIALYGVQFASDSNVASTTDDFVQQFVANHPNAFGVDNLQLTPPTTAMTGDGSLKVYTYQQTLEGLPVHGTVVRIPVRMGATEIISFMGIRILQPPPTPCLPDVLTAEQATNVVLSSVDFGHLTSFSTAEKVIFKTPDKSLHRAWRFDGFDGNEAYQFFVDTNSGAILDAVSQIFDQVYQLKTIVSGRATPGISSIEDSVTEDTPLPGARVTVFGAMPACPVTSVPTSFFAQGFAATDSITGDATFTAYVPIDPVNAVAQLHGQWVRVTDVGGANLLPCQQESVIFGNNYLQFNPEPVFSDATAQVNAFLVVQRTHDWWQEWLNSTAIDLQVHVRVNEFVACGNLTGCNACYDPTDHSLHFFRATSCANSAYSTIISHEYGHFITHRLAPFAERSFHEGAADTVATLLWDTPLNGYNFNHDGLPVRNVDAPDVRLKVCNTQHTSCCPLGDPQCFHCGDEHCQGLALGGAFWDLRQQIGVDETARIFGRFLQITTGILDQSVIVEVLIADDDDGDPADTPHKSQILAAFRDLHGWDSPFCDVGTQVKVGWDLPGDPQPGVDYLITPLCPPRIVLKTQEKEVTPGDFRRVGRWTIGRVDENGNAADLPRITAAWSSSPSGIARDATVYVGTEANAPCSNANLIDVQPTSTANWTSVRVNLTGSISAAARAYPAEQGLLSGKGGSLSGYVAGNVHRLQANRIGEAESQSSTLTILGSSEDGVHIGTVDEGSSVDLGAVIGVDNVIEHGVHGLLTLGSCLFGSLHVYGDSSGDITAWCTIRAVSLTSLIRIHGSMSGDVAILNEHRGSLSILGDMDGDISAGLIAGTVEVTGVMNGDICAPNLPPLPQTVTVSAFGPNATVCGVPVCLSPTAAVASEPIPVSKNRYLSFVPPIAESGSTAIRVKLKSTTSQFRAFEGKTWWVGAPASYTGGGATFSAAQLGCAPAYRNWSADGLIHVYGSQVVPESLYEIEVFRQSDTCVSAKLEVSTAEWGDVTGATTGSAPNGIVNFLDVSAVVLAFQGNWGALSLVRAQMQPDVPSPGVPVTFLDLSRVIDAFVGKPYPFAGPAACP